MEAKIYSCEYWVQETSPKTLLNTYKSKLIESGFKVLNITDHYFQPIGYTAIFLLAESHLAIHTFPEESKTYIQLSSCNKQFYDNFLSLENNKRQHF